MLNATSNHRWKVDYSMGVDVREDPVPVLVDGGEPVAVHAKPESVVHERQYGGAPRMVEGHQVVHRVMHTIYFLLIIVLIEPIIWLRHQQAGFIPMVQAPSRTFVVADPLVQLLGACG